jgi:hypothetical protein
MFNMCKRCRYQDSLYTFSTLLSMAEACVQYKVQ